MTIKYKRKRFLCFFLFWWENFVSYFVVILLEFFSSFFFFEDLNLFNAVIGNQFPFNRYILGYSLLSSLALLCLFGLNISFLPFADLCEKLTCQVFSFFFCWENCNFLLLEGNISSFFSSSFNFILFFKNLNKLEIKLKLNFDI